MNLISERAWCITISLFVLWRSCKMMCVSCRNISNKFQKQFLHINVKSILSFLLFIHVKDQPYSLGWVYKWHSYSRENHSDFTEVRRMYLLSYTRAKSTHSGQILLMASYGFQRCLHVATCVRRKVETDIPERCCYESYWSLKELILTFLLHLFVYLHSLFSHDMFDLNQLQC